MATVKTIGSGDELRVITIGERVSCSCCGCAYNFSIFDALSSSYENKEPMTEWPNDLNIGEFTTIGTFEEETEYSGPLPSLSGGFSLIRVQRDNRKYGARPHGGGGNGSCARFVCARIIYNEQDDAFFLYTHPIPSFGGTLSESSSKRNLKDLLLQYVPNDFWKQTRNVLFKIHFWGWEYVYQYSSAEKTSGPLYKFLAPSDTKFKIQYAEFEKIT